MDENELDGLKKRSKETGCSDHAVEEILKWYGESSKRDRNLQ